MAGALVVLILIIGGCYALRWGYVYVIKQQRIDMASERKRIQQDATRGFRINRQIALRLWKLSKYATPQPPGKKRS